MSIRSTATKSLTGVNESIISAKFLKILLMPCLYIKEFIANMKNYSTIVTVCCIG